MANFSSWAQRRAGRGGGGDGPRQPAPSRQQATPELPLPPAGYAWGFMGGQYVLVPVNGPAPPPSIVAPVRQPARVIPFVPQPVTSQFPPGHATPRAETCVLVKPGDRDTYAELLGSLPDLVPDTGEYDAMAGNPSPATVEAVGQCSEMASIQSGESLRAFPEGAVLSRGSVPLKGN